MANPQVNIQSDMLLWAIDRAGIELEEFKNRFPKLEGWLAAKEKPTLRQLEDFANKVHIPFGHLLLDDPPDEPLPIPYFRTLDAGGRQLSINVRDTIRLLQQRQEWLTEYLKEENYEPLAFVGSFSNNHNLNQIIADIREVIGLETNWAQECHNWEAALGLLTEKLEEQRIIPVFNSVVGINNHRKIPLEECRGLVLVNEYVPFLFVNSADSDAAKMFTIAHELAHIWIGQSAGFDFRNLQPADDPIEKFCDSVAAELLVPADSLRTVWNDRRDMKAVAKQFKVSQIVIARRLLDLAIITRDEFFRFYNEYTSREFRSRQGQAGGDFYHTAFKRLSRKYLKYIDMAIRSNKLLIRDAYNLTGIRGDSFHSLMGKV